MPEGPSSVRAFTISGWMPPVKEMSPLSQGRPDYKAVPLFLCDVPLCKVGSLDMGQVFFDVQDQFQLLQSVVPPSTVIFLSVMRLPRLSTSPWNSSMRLRINQPPPRRRPGAAGASGRRWGTAGLAGPSSLHGPFRHQFHSAEHGRCRRSVNVRGTCRWRRSASGASASSSRRTGLKRY